MRRKTSRCSDSRWAASRRCTLAAAAPERVRGIALLDTPTRPVSTSQQDIRRAQAAQARHIGLRSYLEQHLWPNYVAGNIPGSVTWLTKSCMTWPPHWVMDTLRTADRGWRSTGRMPSPCCASSACQRWSWPASKTVSVPRRSNELSLQLFQTRHFSAGARCWALRPDGKAGRRGRTCGSMVPHTCAVVTRIGQNPRQETP